MRDDTQHAASAGCRPPRSRVVSGALALLATAGLAAAAAPAQSTDRGAVDIAQPRDVEDVPEATPGSPDGADDDASRSLDEAPAARAESLDSLDRAEPGDPDNADLVWQPPACDALPAPDVDVPDDGDASEWEAALAGSLRRVDAAHRDVEQATRAFASSLDRAADRPTERARLGDRRAAARDRYGEARCAHQALREAARRAGVLPGMLRRYELPREAD